jgi:hypothetical protein
LIEDITGVRCANCPKAATEATNILNSKTEDSVVVVALYPDKTIMPIFTTPWPGFPELTSSLSTNIVNALGAPNGLPNGYIDRHIFSGRTNRYAGQTEWQDLVNQRLQLASPVIIEISKTFDPSGRVLKINVKAIYTNDVIGSTHKLSVLLTESEIASKQTMPIGTSPPEKDDYIHNHATRLSLTQFLGNPLSASLVAGRVFEKEFEIVLPAEYDENHCHIVAMVLETGSESVVQVRQTDL